MCEQPLLTCSECGAPTQTAAHREYIRERLPEHMRAHLDRELCPECARLLADRPGVGDIRPAAIMPPGAWQTRARRWDSMIQVCNLFISPGHNYYGHHGKPAGENPIVAVEQIECVAGHGIRGDRFFDYKPDYQGQITFFAMEVIEALGRELNLDGVRPEFTRRNVVTRGVDLNTLDWRRV